MSRGDVLVVLEGELASVELPCVGDPLLIEIDLPANHAFGQKCMQCQATVVRVSNAGDGPASIGHADSQDAVSESRRGGKLRAGSGNAA